jgi:asparagine synthase (glutamine-hydrolysing)
MRKLQMSDLSPELVESFARVLRARIDAANADAILLSGGLDTSTIAAFAAQKGSIECVTVCVRSDAPIDPAHRDLLAGKLGCDPASFPSPDAAFAQECATTLHLPHALHFLSLDDLLSHAPATVRAIRSFDPMQVRNGIPIYVGLVGAKARGAQRVFTGDGADEMYAGYSHMWGMAPEKLAAYLRHMASIMRFTTPDLAAAVGIETVSPFTEPALVNLAFQLPHAAFIGERDGRVMGKWVVRKAVERLLPGSLVWRVKTPIEYGSGSTFLGPLMNARISDAEFADAQAELLARDGVRLREKEQLYYYRSFREIFGPVSAAAAGKGDCPYCGTVIDPPNRNYCGVCGAWGFAGDQP